VPGLCLERLSSAAASSYSLVHVSRSSPSDQPSSEPCEHNARSVLSHVARGRLRGTAGTISPEL
jgi:hypothetical protein